MSKFPFPPVPYSPPPVDPRVWGMASPNAAARTAGVWQLILGGLIFFTGTCAMAAVWVVPDQVLADAIRQQQAQFPPIQNMTMQQEIRMIMTIGSGVMIIAGAVLSLLAVFVRRGGKVAIVLSMLGGGLIALLMLINFVSGLLQLASRPAAIVQVVMIGGILALVGTTFAKLIAALQSSGSAQQIAQQQAYYWMMQQQSGYGAGAGYGYGQTAAPPPPLPNQNPPQPPG
jgi:hypothetical protein